MVAVVVSAPPGGCREHTEIAADGSVAENRGLNSTHVLGRFPTAADAAQRVRRVLDGPWEHLHDG